MGLAALELGKRTPQSTTYDPGFWIFGGNKFRSHGDESMGNVDMRKSIVKSSNTYYYALANDLGVDTIHDFMSPLGFGRLTGIDLNGEQTGILPNQAWKRQAYSRSDQQRWYAGETISLGIGQGYNAFTMLQLALATATVANGGNSHQPHVVRATRDSRASDAVKVVEHSPTNLNYKASNIAVIVDAMVGVTQEGTSRFVFGDAPYLSAGKTGTAQAVTIGQNEKYDAEKMAEYERDHSLYIAFAPANDPQIALAIIVENSGFGSAHAAPIARRVFDYVLTNRYPNTADIAAVQKGLATAPIGTPLNADEVPLYRVPDPTTEPGKAPMILGLGRSRVVPQPEPSGADRSLAVPAESTPTSTPTTEPEPKPGPVAALKLASPGAVAPN